MLKTYKILSTRGSRKILDSICFSVVHKANKSTVNIDGKPVDKSRRLLAELKLRKEAKAAKEFAPAYKPAEPFVSKRFVSKFVKKVQLTQQLSHILLNKARLNNENGRRSAVNIQKYVLSTHHKNERTDNMLRNLVNHSRTLVGFSPMMWSFLKDPNADEVEGKLNTTLYTTEYIKSFISSNTISSANKFVGGLRLCDTIVFKPSVLWAMHNYCELPLKDIISQVMFGTFYTLHAGFTVHKTKLMPIESTPVYFVGHSPVKDDGTIGILPGAYTKEGMELLSNMLKHGQVIRNAMLGPTLYRKDKHAYLDAFYWVLTLDEHFNYDKAICLVP